jgi:peptidyl-prolyl cis-trans isomerase SurA
VERKKELTQIIKSAMKKLFLLNVMLFSIAFGFSQSLISYGKYTVNQAEFLRAYNKNKTTVTDKEKSIRDYVELYTNFKLKVKAAQDLKLDTSEQLKSDLDNFRHQIEENYMSDEKTFKFLMDEAFNRSQYDIHIIRYTINSDPNAEPTDSMQKFLATQSVYEALKAKSTSADILASNPDAKFVDMGYATAFSIPYVYENIVFGLKPGEFSKPYRSRKAWHIFQALDKRKSAGKWKISQILFTSPPNADDATKINAKKLADSVHELLKTGADFGAMARSYSDDKLTYLSGGEMPEFSTGKFDISFESEVVKLKNDNEFSAPFNTSFGIHIIKRLSFTSTPSSKEDESFQFDLKQKLMQDDRIQLAKDKFANEILTKIGFKQSSMVSPKDLLRYVDTIMNNTEDLDITTKTPISNKVIINYTKGNIKGEDWLNYARDFKSNPEMYNEETNAEIWEKYKIATSLDYYKKNLELFNSEFANQLEEFREGNMLFEVMEKQVWSKASTDSTGLRNYYEANKKQYTWAASADVQIFNASSSDVANAALEKLNNGSDWQELVDEKQGELQSDSGRFELTQINGSTDAIPGSFSTIAKNADGSATFIKYHKQYPNGEQRNFEDAKGMVINDYQNVVEKNWIETLRKKYPVKINEALLLQLIKSNK